MGRIHSSHEKVFVEGLSPVCAIPLVAHLHNTHEIGRRNLLVSTRLASVLAMIRGRSPKWARMYTGPFTVMERRGLVNYRLRKTAHSKPIVVHVDKLRPCFEDGLHDASENAAPDDDMIDAMPDASPNSQRPKRTIRRPARFQ